MEQVYCWTIHVTSYRSTSESLGELEKAVETLGLCSHCISCPPKLLLMLLELDRKGTCFLFLKCSFFKLEHISDNTTYGTYLEIWTVINTVICIVIVIPCWSCKGKYKMSEYSCCIPTAYQSWACKLYSMYVPEVVFKMQSPHFLKCR